MEIKRQENEKTIISLIKQNNSIFLNISPQTHNAATTSIESLPIRKRKHKIECDLDTAVGFVLAGVGNVDLWRSCNYLIVNSKTTIKQIEDAFKEFTAREDIDIVLISQHLYILVGVSGCKYGFLVDSYNKPVPAILEIPSKDHPYDPLNDSVLSRVKYLFSAESVASGRR
ncbi:hypothetical protein UlMin_031550 [Ulmus minor]